MTVSPDYVIALVFNMYVPFPPVGDGGFRVARGANPGLWVSIHRSAMSGVSFHGGEGVQKRRETSIY